MNNLDTLGLPTGVQPPDGLFSFGLAPSVTETLPKPSGAERSADGQAQVLLRNQAAIREMAVSDASAAGAGSQGDTATASLDYVKLIDPTGKTSYTATAPAGSTDPKDIMVSLPQEKGSAGGKTVPLFDFLKISAAERKLTPNEDAFWDGRSAGSFPIEDEIYTYTGSDIRVLIEPVLAPSDGAQQKQLLECTTLTISVHREKSPVRAVSYINPKGFARGRRTIAGTLVLTQFTVDVMYRFLYGGYDGHDLSADSYFKKPDQLPPFNATIILADEFGHLSYRRLLGIDMVDSGEIYSINDMLTEQTLTYMASDYTPLLPLDSSALMKRKAGNRATAPPTMWDARQKTGFGQLRSPGIV